MGISLKQQTSTREFIRQSFQTLQKTVPTLTLEAFADRLGLGRSTLKMIASGQRRLTPQQAIAVGRALRLSADEIHHLQILALSEAAESSWEKAYYSGLLKKSRAALRGMSQVTAASVLLEDPLAQPILVLLVDHQKQAGDETAPWLAEKLGVSKAAVCKSLAALRKSGLLDEAPEGGWHLRIDRLTNKLGQKKFIKESLLKTAERIEKDYGNAQSLFINYTFSTTEERLARLQLELRELMEKHLTENPSAEMVQVASAAFQVFPYQRQP